MKFLALWSKEGLTQDEAIKIANSGDCGLRLARKEGDKPDFDQRPSAYDALTGHYPTLYAPRTLAEVVEAAKVAYPKTISRCNRWIQHLQNRIAYEKAMLEEQGAGDLLKPKPKKQLPPICNYDGEVTLAGMYGNAPKTMKMHHMTKAEYAAINKDYRGCRYAADKSHRVRVALVGNGWAGGRSYAPVFLTDSKIHEIPEAPEQKEEPEPVVAAPRPAVHKEERTVFDDMKDQLKAGVRVVSAAQLFVTPAALAQRMVDLAGVDETSQVLEPSAGTGVIVQAIRKTGAAITVYEINRELSEALQDLVQNNYQGDFLAADYDQMGCFDAVIMNPPFANAADIAHIQHALRFLEEGGRLVAICANGPRQNRILKPIVEAAGGLWEPLPAGTFKESGTNVNTVLLSLTK